MNDAQALKAAQKLLAYSQFPEQRDPEESARILHVANSGMAAVTAHLHDRAAAITSRTRHLSTCQARRVSRA